MSNETVYKRTQKLSLRIVASSFLIGCSIGIGITFQQYKQSTSPAYTPTTSHASATIKSIYPLFETGRVEIKEVYVTKRDPEPSTIREWISNRDIWSQENDQGWTQPILKLHNDVATEIATYMQNQHNDPIMLASFMQESGFNPNARGSAGEYGICQMMPNRTNNVWIRDERWNNWKRQADRCIDKRKAVPWKTKGVILTSYGSNAYKKYLH